MHGQQRFSTSFPATALVIRRQRARRTADLIARDPVTAAGLFTLVLFVPLLVWWVCLPLPQQATAPGALTAASQESP